MNLTVIKQKSGFSLLEVLVVLVIFSTVIISAVSIVLKTARISLDNEISDRANNAAVRVLELTKKADSTYKNCNNPAQPLNLTQGIYSLGEEIDLAATNPEDIACYKLKRAGVISGTDKITSCSDTSEYKTQVKFPANDAQAGIDFVDYEEFYCIQILVENVQNSNLNKTTLVVVYDTPTQDNIINEYYAFRKN